MIHSANVGPTSAFSIGEEFNAVIEPNSIKLLPVTFSPSQNPGSYSTTLTVTTNDPLNLSYTIPLEGIVSEPPAPVISGFRNTPEGFVLNLEATDSVFYGIEWSSDLTADSWGFVPGYASFRFGGQYRSINLSDFLEGNGEGDRRKVFFRIVRSNPGE